MVWEIPGLEFNLQETLKVVWIILQSALWHSIVHNLNNASS